MSTKSEQKKELERSRRVSSYYPIFGRRNWKSQKRSKRVSGTF